MISLHHQFTVDLGVTDTWALLTDLPKVATCMPGAGIDEVVDGEFRGGLATRIGPISARYTGTAVFREFDEVGHHAVIEARGREEKGSGSATALITTHLKPDGEQTIVDVSTELAVSGKAAQFGRSLLTEVSNSIVEQFVTRLEAMIATGTSDDTAAAQSAPTAATSPSAGARHETSAPAGGELDVVTAVALPLLRKAAVPVAAALGGVLLGALLGRRAVSRSRSGYGSAGLGGIPVTYVLPFPTTFDPTLPGF